MTNERLKHEREQRGWSQSYLATQLGVPDSGTISRWERGAVQPSRFYQGKMCALFGKTAEELGFIAPASATNPHNTPGDISEKRRGHNEPLETEQAAVTSAFHLDFAPEQETDPHQATTRPLPMQDGAANWNLSHAATQPSRALLVAACVVALFLVLGGVLLGVSLLAGHPQPPMGASVVGYLSFTSSGQVSDTSNQGITDTIQMDLHALAPLPPGQAYYAWLLPDRANPEQPVVSLGQLVVHAGAVHFFYSDPLHTNLLGTTGQLLITEQASVSPPPSFPSVETSNWRYVASIPQASNPQDTLNHFSLLDHLRHLLSDDPSLKALGLRGGLSIWFDRSMQDMLSAAVSAREHWHPNGTANTQAIREQVIRVLNYLDGTAFSRPGAPGKSRVALLEFDPRQNPPGYVRHIPLHIRGVIEAPGANGMQRVLADQLLAAMDRVNAWLQVVYRDAVQLVMMSDTQLESQTALSLLDDLRGNASNAFAGQTDPVTGQVLGGVQWIYQRMPGLATLQVTPYQSS